jgi:hypothetical protein
VQKIVKAVLNWTESSNWWPRYCRWCRFVAVNLDRLEECQCWNKISTHEILVKDCCWKCQRDRSKDLEANNWSTIVRSPVGLLMGHTVPVSGACMAYGCVIASNNKR